VKRSLVLLLLLVIVTFNFLASCSVKEDPKVGTTESVSESTTAALPLPPVEPSGKLIVGVKEATGNFNPLYYSTPSDGDVINLLFQGLIKRNREGVFESVIADHWTFSEDGKSITFFLKKDIVFSDGQPLTANDVVFTYQVLADPSYTGGFKSAVKDLVGYDAYYSGETTEFSGVEAKNDYEVTFNFKEALRINLENCALSIVPMHYYGVDFSIGNTSHIEAITTYAMGSGPYVISQFSEHSQVSLKRNTLYSGEGYHIKEINLKFYDDPETLKLENFDLLPGIVASKKFEAAKTSGFSVNQYNKKGYKYVKTNCEWGPTADPKVRQALYYAFDVKKFVTGYNSDIATDELLAAPQYHPFSQASWAIDASLVNTMIDYDYNLDQAKSLLDEAGWRVDSSGFRYKDGALLELKILAIPDDEILAKLIEMWEKEWGQGLGIKVTVSYLELNTILDYVIYNSNANVEKWSLFYLATSIASPDPDAIYTSFHSDFIGNRLDNTSRYSNPEVDALLDKGRATMSVDAAKPIYARVAKILNKEAVMMPIYANTYFDLYAPKLVDFKTFSFYNWVDALKDARIVE